jgi:ribosomal protein S18 acetylase RimI-like enzyme
MSPHDRARVGEILRGTGHFREKEVEVALELFDGGFGIGGLALDLDYQFVGAYGVDGKLLGYANYGPTPHTDRTWDLYWIAVAREAHGKGVGSTLLAEVERRLKEAGARLLLIETSSRTDYDATRGFYVARGYTEQARIRDFYAPDDDRVMLTKTLYPDAR